MLHENVIATPHLDASTMEAQKGVIEIAQAVAGALKGELAATAVNAPMVPTECLQVLSELGPYVVLEEKLCKLAMQLVAGGSGVKSIKVAGNSDDLDTLLLQAMIIKGLIEPISCVFLTLVSADITAKQSGPRIIEECIMVDGSPENPHSLSRFKVPMWNPDLPMQLVTGEIVVEGKVKEGKLQLTKVRSFGVKVSLEGGIILCRQVEPPGIIGKVGSILGQENVNVNFMSVGRIAA